ncbi:hypothetical protein CANARDRAFT_174062 [[Candida] arabinofermentans NRRL YB-2248]|uniref:Uncharacterized protein n=1 Tax=[Candida] arabinofermentans NRRL YB-2248 TaxID=983967 RepID=A0A1E4T8Z4_9ASCO|nr:hypothetical protein CANARDRAFT_174062 [[Candida] arabinofermentans NRRL YB-2248]
MPFKAELSAGLRQGVCVMWCGGRREGRKNQSILGYFTINLNPERLLEACMFVNVVIMRIVWLFPSSPGTKQ